MRSFMMQKYRRSPIYRGVREAINCRIRLGALPLIAGVAAAAGLAEVTTSIAHAAQPAYRQQAIAGFNPVQVAYNSRPAFVDLDDDGDFDIVLGNADGRLVYFRNDAIKFVPQFGSANPFNGVVGGKEPRPAFGDVDGDDDLDAVVGQSDGSLRYLENVGSASEPDFVERLGAENPFDLLGVDDSSAPVLSNLDADSDLDLIVGGADGRLRYFRNEGLAGFVAQTGIDNPFDSVDTGLLSVPELVDLDADNDLDLLVGGLDGSLSYFRNEGTDMQPTFIELVDDDNPFDALDVGFLSSPTAADLDDDGDFDVVSGEEYGELHYFENSGSDEDPVFSELEGPLNPFFGFDTGYHATFALGDLDDDSDADVIAGEIQGRLRLLDNVGDMSQPVFALVDPNPLANRDVGYFSAPAMGDLDDDGDLDMVVGDYYGNFRLFENVTSGLSPEFVERTGASNPLAGFDVGASAAPTLVDIDDDGDLDVFSGDYLGEISFLENTGSSTNADFNLAAGNNPLQGLDLGSRSKPVAADLDEDGDFDLVVGEESARRLNFIENTGDPANPVMVLRAGQLNPFVDIDVGRNAAPAAFDLDGDSDIDLLVGRESPGILYLEAFNAAPVLDTSADTQLDPIPEDTLSEFNEGLSVAELLARTAGVTDSNAGTEFGIALVGTDVGNGSWDYLLIAGEWLPAAGILDENALLLGPDARLRFQPDPDFNGASQALFRAWDQSDGASGDAGVNTAKGASGGEAPYSAAVEAIDIVIEPVNDPPFNLAPPTILGIGDVGQELNVVPGSWSDAIDVAPGDLSFSYQWVRVDNIVTLENLEVLVGEIGLTYSVTPADLNKYLRVIETVTDNGEGIPASTTASIPSGFIGVPDPLFKDDFELKPIDE